MLAEPTLITHPASQRQAVSLNEARLYLSMRLRAWPDSTPVSVFVLPDDSPLHEEVTVSLLQVFPYQLRRAWDRQLFTGTGQAPTTVPTEAEMIRRVAETPGAIGYASNVPADAPVRALAVRP